LDSLSNYLESSTKTNILFQSDKKNLNKQKLELENEINKVKKQYQFSQCFLNDCSTKKLEYLEKIKSEILIEYNMKKEMNKKSFIINKIIYVLSIGFKKVCKILYLIDIESNTSQESQVIYIKSFLKKMIQFINFNY
jgi:hypothetical protein